MRPTIVLLGLCLLAPATASAGGLREYKEQKHGQREAVSSEQCQPKYIERCVASCAAGDAACAQRCEAEAPEFCRKREVRQVVKTAEVAVKGASLFAGAAAVVLENVLGEKPPDNVGPYTIFFHAGSASAELGGGLLIGGAMGASLGMQLRYSYFGVSGMTQYLRDGGDWLSESDVGPTGWIASGHILYGAQPSLLVSAGNGVRTLYGIGLRSYTTFMVGQVFLGFDPMLGYINRQWNYHLRIGVGYRFTPNLYARFNYDYRDILDLNDLDISQASLQGGFLVIGFRIN